MSPDSTTPPGTGKPRPITAVLGLLAASVLLLSACEDTAMPDLSVSDPQAGAVQSQIEHQDQQDPVAAEPAETSQQAPAPAENPVGTFGGPSGQDLVDQSVTALGRLEALPVKGRAPKTGYSRDRFGPNWADDVTVTYGGNGCDTRNDILKRDLKQISYRADDHGCTVVSGILDDPFTGETIEFTRGEQTSADVQIDHLVALSDAWQKGAQQLDDQARRDFANDPRNLLAVSGPMNQAKSDSDAASWLPPNRSYRCTYVAKQIEVKTIYDLWVTQAERQAMIDVLVPCANATS